MSRTPSVSLKMTYSDLDLHTVTIFQCAFDRHGSMKIVLSEVSEDQCWIAKAMIFRPVLQISRVLVQSNCLSTNTFL